MPPPNDRSPVDSPFDELCDRFPEFEKKLERVQRLLATSDTKEREEGVRLLADCGEKNADLAESVFTILQGLLRDSDPDVQESAEYGLDRLGRPAFDRLLKLLRDRDADDTNLLARLLRALGHFHFQKDTSG